MTSCEDRAEEAGRLVTAQLKLQAERKHASGIRRFLGTHHAWKRECYVQTNATSPTGYQMNVTYERERCVICGEIREKTHSYYPGYD